MYTESFGWRFNRRKELARQVDKEWLRRYHLHSVRKISSWNGYIKIMQKTKSSGRTENVFVLWSYWLFRVQSKTITVWTQPCKHWTRRATKNCFALWALMHCLLKNWSSFICFFLYIVSSIQRTQWTLQTFVSHQVYVPLQVICFCIFIVASMHVTWALQTCFITPTDSLSVII